MPPLPLPFKRTRAFALPVKRTRALERLLLAGSKRGWLVGPGRFFLCGVRDLLLPPKQGLLALWLSSCGWLQPSVLAQCMPSVLSVAHIWHRVCLLDPCRVLSVGAVVRIGAVCSGSRAASVASVTGLGPIHLTSVWPEGCSVLRLLRILLSHFYVTYLEEGRHATYWLRRGCAARLPLFRVCCAGPAGPASFNHTRTLCTALRPALPCGRHCAAAGTAHTHAHTYLKHMQCAGGATAPPLAAAEAAVLVACPLSPDSCLQLHLTYTPMLRIHASLLRMPALLSFQQHHMLGS